MYKILDRHTEQYKIKYDIMEQRKRLHSCRRRGRPLKSIKIGWR